MTSKLNHFIDFTKDAFSNKTLVRITLGKYKGTDTNLEKIIIKPIEIQSQLYLSFTTTFYKSQKDIVKNYSLDQGVELLTKLIGVEFFVISTFTIKKDLKLILNNKNEPKLILSKPVFNEVKNYSNNKEEFKFIDVKRDKYLISIGLISKEGNIYARKRSKLIQIDNFIEVVINSINNSNIKNKKDLKILDMGCGRGYLTVALYDYLTNILNLQPVIIGIDRKKEYIQKGNDLANDNKYINLSFVESNIFDFNIIESDIVIALHACDTATDDAMLKGIKSKSTLIITVPCCQRELRDKIKIPYNLQPILRYPAVLERQIEILTDSIRALFFESKGYEVKVFEFTSLEHTGRNIMIIANKKESQNSTDIFTNKINQLKKDFQIDQLYIES